MQRSADEKLKRITAKWRAAIPPALIQLQEHARLQDGQKMKMNQLMIMFHINPQLFPYDEDDECFVTENNAINK